MQHSPLLFVSPGMGASAIPWRSPRFLPCCVFFTIIVSLVIIPSTSSTTSSLSRGSSSLFAGDDDHPHVLVSPDTSYTCGFYSVGPNAYTFSIWVTHAVKRTVVWTANRDHPVNGHGARITMRKSGSLALTDADGTAVWSTNTSGTPANRVELLDTGNLVVKDPEGNVLWQSFDYPTDTLLATQTMTKATKLVSAAPNGSLASGFYNSYFDNDNVIKLIYYGKETSSIYWPNIYFPMWMSNRNTYNGTRLAVFDHMGQFISSDNLTFKASDMGSEIMRRLTLDYDGNLRMYSLNKTTGTWYVAWEAIPQLCQVHGVCGKYGICTYSQLKPYCSCPPYYDMVDPSDWSQGCEPKFNVSICSKIGWDFHELPNTDFWGYDRTNALTVSLEECKQQCLEDCSCMGLLYRTGSGVCYTKGDQFFHLFNGQTSPNNIGNTYLKVPKSTAPTVVGNHTCNTSMEIDVPAAVYKRNGGSKVKWSYFYAFVLLFGVMEMLFLIPGWWLILRNGRRPNSIGEGYDMIPGQIRKFTYKELKKATGNFKHELGRGASGAAYKGVLDDKGTVAVKKLEGLDQGEEEFQAELNLIGRINHMNLVRMFGFCAEGKNRLLVSEYVENRALDRYLFDNNDAGCILGWRERYKIAIGVAKGLAYLHHECLEWVIHCDIKPENILLDSDFEPKIADFGLAKLSKRGAVDRNISRVRGTRGYMAPEWTSNLPITSKVDVYSYGVVLLELVRGCRISKWMSDEEGNMHNNDVMSWIRALKAKLRDAEDKSWIGGFVDLKLDGKYDMKQAEVMVDVSVSCLEVETSQRPTMDLIVQALLSSDHE